MDVKGKVLRIERASSYDGDGLRTVVFFKGCPLRCLWCSTPESQSALPEIGYKKESCVHCRKCAAVCREKVFEFDPEGNMTKKTERCLGCGHCAAQCPANALTLYGREAAAAEIVEEIAKDEIFYFHSGGGFTLSGGEALMQPKFAAEILRLSARRGIGGTIETSCAVPWENVEEVLPYLGIIYIDIKHMNGEKHKQYTGCSNRQILENIRKIDASGNTRIVIRVPFIPTINDSGENLAEVMKFCSELKNLREIELLAYHRLGAETYRRLGRPVPLDGVSVPSQTEIYGKASAMKRINPKITVKINGQEI